VRCLLGLTTPGLPPTTDIQVGRLGAVKECQKETKPIDAAAQRGSRKRTLCGTDGPGQTLRWTWPLRRLRNLPKPLYTRLY
jgi:hypothetical protein